MSLQQLRWLILGVPIAFLAILEGVRLLLEPSLARSPLAYGLEAVVAAAGLLAFGEMVVRAADRMQQRHIHQNRELLALHEAGLAVVRELRLETVLQRVVDQARDLAHAQYAALSVLQEDGSIEAFLTSGITPEERARIGPLPTGKGLLGVVLREGQRLRLRDMTSDHRTAGFPPNHPSMRSLLAVPILAADRVLGNLYLTEKDGSQEFTLDDEETLARFATQAAVAISNARLHREVQAAVVTLERERIAREMHDSLAQLLGYVNTKAQAVQELLDHGQAERAAGQLRQLAEAARAAYADVREAILGLRTSVGADQSLVGALREYVERWGEQAGIRAELIGGDQESVPSNLAPAAEVQLLRIVQEALTNVRKHSSATHARVHLCMIDGALEVSIEDDGIGFDPSAPGRGLQPRFGLATMRERAEAIGGELIINSTPGKGARLTARIPLASPEIPWGN